MAYQKLPSKTTSDTWDITAYNIARDNFIAQAPDVFTTKGDLYVATGADAGTRLAAGADDSILVYDSSQTGGLDTQIVPAASVNNSVAQDPAVDTWVALTWDTEDFDTDGMHSTSSNTNRFTIPSGGAGKYLIKADVQFGTAALSAGTGGEYGIRLLLNGTTVVGKFYDEAEAAADSDHVYSVSSLLDLSVSDWLEVQVYTSQDINIGSTNSKFEAIWMRR